MVSLFSSAIRSCTNTLFPPSYLDADVAKLVKASFFDISLFFELYSAHALINFLGAYSCYQYGLEYGESGPAYAQPERDPLVIKKLWITLLCLWCLNIVYQRHIIKKFPSDFLGRFFGSEKVQLQFLPEKNFSITPALQERYTPYHNLVLPTLSADVDRKSFSAKTQETKLVIELHNQEDKEEFISYVSSPVNYTYLDFIGLIGLCICSLNNNRSSNNDRSPTLDFLAEESRVKRMFFAKLVTTNSSVNRHMCFFINLVYLQSILNFFCYLVFYLDGCLEKEYQETCREINTLPSLCRKVPGPHIYALEKNFVTVAAFLVPAVFSLSRYWFFMSLASVMKRK